MAAFLMNLWRLMVPPSQAFEHVLQRVLRFISSYIELHRNTWNYTNMIGCFLILQALYEQAASRGSLLAVVKTVFTEMLEVYFDIVDICCQYLDTWAETVWNQLGCVGEDWGAVDFEKIRVSVYWAPDLDQGCYHTRVSCKTNRTDTSTQPTPNRQKWYKKYIRVGGNNIYI
jgi:hypothetical protein